MSNSNQKDLFSRLKSSDCLHTVRKEDEFEPFLVALIEQLENLGKTGFFPDSLGHCSRLPTEDEEKIIIKIMNEFVDADSYPYYISPSYSDDRAYFAFHQGVKCLRASRAKKGQYSVEETSTEDNAKIQALEQDWANLQLMKHSNVDNYVLELKLLIRKSIKLKLFANTEDAKYRILNTLGIDFENVREFFQFQTVDEILRHIEVYANYSEASALVPHMSCDTTQGVKCDASEYTMLVDSELWIGDVRDYKGALRLNREEYGRITVFDYDSESTRRYLFKVDFEDERPSWQLLVRDAILSCYDILCRGGDFTKITFPGIVVTRSIEQLKRLH